MKWIMNLGCQIMKGFVGPCKHLTFILSKMGGHGQFGAEMRLNLKKTLLRITMPAVLRGD